MSVGRLGTIVGVFTAVAVASGSSRRKAKAQMESRTSLAYLWLGKSSVKPSISTSSKAGQQRVCYSPRCLLEHPLYNCLNLGGVQPKEILTLDANVGVWQDVVRPSAGVIKGRVDERTTTLKICLARGLDIRRERNDERVAPRLVPPNLSCAKTKNI